MSGPLQGPQAGSYLADRNAKAAKQATTNRPNQKTRQQANKQVCESTLHLIDLDARSVKQHGCLLLASGKKTCVPRTSLGEAASNRPTAHPPATQPWERNPQGASQRSPAKAIWATATEVAPADTDQSQDTGHRLKISWSPQSPGPQPTRHTQGPRQRPHTHPTEGHGSPLSKL